MTFSCDEWRKGLPAAQAEVEVAEQALEEARRTDGGEEHSKERIAQLESDVREARDHVVFLEKMANDPEQDRSRERSKAMMDIGRSLGLVVDATGVGLSYRSDTWKRVVVKVDWRNGRVREYSKPLDPDSTDVQVALERVPDLFTQDANALRLAEEFRRRIEDVSGENQ